jgi:hypothetical protein
VSDFSSPDFSSIDYIEERIVPDIEAGRTDPVPHEVGNAIRHITGFVAANVGDIDDELMCAMKKVDAWLSHSDYYLSPKALLRHVETALEPYRSR